MGVGELRESFNAVSQPAFTCTLALLDYERGHIKGKFVEWQILLFRGTSADGIPFVIKSLRLNRDADLNIIAKAVAQKLLDQRKT